MGRNTLEYVKYVKPHSINMLVEIWNNPIDRWLKRDHTQTRREVKKRKSGGARVKRGSG